jgi:hypothetical protein
MAAEPDFASRPLRWTTIVFAFVLLAVFIRINDFIDVSETALERMNIIQSPTLRLAEKSARSEFSERLTRLAWRRLYWGHLAAQRIADEASPADIDTAWSAYINASADWNSEVMILIVGLGKYYGEKRRDHFEFTILNAFYSYDDALRALRRSHLMLKIRAAQPPEEADRSEVHGLFETFSSRYRDLNIELYDFTLCFEPGKAVKPFCKSGERVRS